MENGVHAIGVHVKDLIDKKEAQFLWEQGRTSDERA